MKKIKMVVLLLILVAVGLLIYQNRDYFFAKKALSLSLGVESWNWTFTGIWNLGYFGICLAIGLLITGVKCLSIRMKSKKTIKGLNSDIESHLGTISSLKTELEKYTSDPYLKKSEQEKTESGQTGSLPETKEAAPAE
ncbi:MAG: hypothetical protein K9J83_07970 [Desulfarculaceae bacterium]|nr:hypothetical protein [Desulfarculaceae bacterium]